VRRRILELLAAAEHSSGESSRSSSASHATSLAEQTCRAPCILHPSGVTSDGALKASVLQGDLAGVRQALDDGADPNVVVGAKRGHKEVGRDIAPDGFKALHVAAYHDDAALGALLIAFKADVDSRTRFGKTPFAIAVEWGSPAIARVLIDAGVDPDGAGGSLVGAAGRGDLEMVELLLGAGARKGIDEAVSSACGYRGNVDVLRTLVAAGADPGPVRGPDWSARVFALDRRRYDCLAVLRASFEPHTLVDAVIDGDLEGVEARLAAVETPGPPLRHGLTELACAARVGRRAIARRLVEAGAAVDEQTLWGTPIFCALSAGHLELAGDLHAHGASLKDLHGPLLHARGGVEAVAWLCQREPPDDIEVLLCTSIEIGDVQIVGWLLSFGADPNGVDAWGRCPLALAVAADRVAIVHVLLDAGADPKARDDKGHPISHYVLTYDGMTEDWRDPSFDRSRYDRESPALTLEAMRLILALGAPLPWDDGSL
jgi:ankyrin repeat protein